MTTITAGRAVAPGGAIISEQRGGFVGIGSHDVHLLVPQPKYIEYILCRPWPHICGGREARDACLKPDSGRKHVGFNTSGILGVEIFQRVIMRLLRAERAGTAFATRPLRIEILQH